MSDVLYSLDMLRLAAATVDFPRLTNPDVTVERRSATCGSRIVIDLVFDADGRVAAFGHQVNACALGQAAATLFARHAVGRSAVEIRVASDSLALWLADGAAAQPDWPEIERLEPARRYPARHGSIRLAFEAATEAMQQVAA